MYEYVRPFSFIERQIAAGRRKEFKKKAGRQRERVAVQVSEALHWQVSDGAEF